MNRDKLIELLKCAWDSGHGSYHDCKREWEYKEDWKNFLDDYEDEISELLTTEDNTSENTLPIDSVSEIRGKLTPIVNLIAIIENGVPNKSDKHHKVYLKEIENCKRVINDLAQREVYSR